MKVWDTGMTDENPAKIPFHFILAIQKFLNLMALTHISAISMTGAWERGFFEKIRFFCLLVCQINSFTFNRKNRKVQAGNAKFFFLRTLRKPLRPLR